MKNTPIELLSPAKDLEVGLAALNHGADAVYIGGPAFGAREKVGNSIADIAKLCDHAALFDAKVYVTLNTLLFDHELEQARKIAYDCWNAGVDALIVQDMKLLQLDLPPIALHASTQCDNLTVEKVKALEMAGFSQVVLGRELSLDEILEIRRQTTVPLEFFVHGALCVSHSGQCFLSQYIGNRSANRGACAQPCRLPWDLLDEEGKVLIKGKHLLCLKDMNNSANLEELLDAGITSLKIEGRLKDADYVKNITAYYRRQLDAIFERRPEYVQASQGRGVVDFEVNPEKSFNRGFTDYFLHGRQKNIESSDTPKSMGEYVGEVVWCNSVRMDVQTDKVLHNGDGLCFLDDHRELVGIRADVVRGHSVSTNKPHGAHRGTAIYRNYDIEWQRQVEASNGSRRIPVDLVFSETASGYTFSARSGTGVEVSVSLDADKIAANNPEKAQENIRKKALQWGDTVFNPVSLELRFSQPYLIPAALIGEMRRRLAALLTERLIEDHRSHRVQRDRSVVSNLENTAPITFDKEPGLTLMTCHHCIRFANGMCSKETGQKATPLYLRNGDNTFRLDFDCRRCLMKVISI